MDDLGGLCLILFFLPCIIFNFYFMFKVLSDSHESEQQNKVVYGIANRYDQVAVAREEIKYQNDKLKIQL